MISLILHSAARTNPSINKDRQNMEDNLLLFIFGKRYFPLKAQTRVKTLVCHKWISTQRIQVYTFKHGTYQMESFPNVPWLRRLLRMAASEDMDACLSISVACKEASSIHYTDTHTYHTHKCRHRIEHKKKSEATRKRKEIHMLLPDRV